MSTSFTVNLADLTRILEQIKIAERNAAGESLVDIIGPDAAILPMGLRTVDGSFNHLLPGQELVGAADQTFPRMLPADFRLETDGDTYTIVRADVAGAPPGGVTITGQNYDPTIPGSHSIADADMRIISNLIVDATLNNPAALQAALYAAIVPAGTNDLNAAQGAELTAAISAITTLHTAFKASSAASADAQRTETAYLAAVASGTTVNTQETVASTKLAALLAGVADGDPVDALDTANVADALAAANAAVAAQQALVKTLQFEVDVAPGITSADADLAAAKSLLAELHSTALAVQAVSAAFADGTVEAADIALINTAIASAGTASTDAGTNLVTLTADQGAATAASNAADLVMNADIVALNTEVNNDGLEISSDGSLTIKNRSPDVGLSPGFNGWMTFFGQFFDHGLDLVTKGNNGTIYIPLQADDSLYDKGQDGLVGDQQVRDADGNLVFHIDPTSGLSVPTLHNDDGYGADGVVGTVDDRPNFMALTRATTFIDPVTGLKTATQNTTTPFVDQNQTYTSISSHQVFLREYKLDATGHAISTGHMLDGDVSKGSLQGSIANWGEVKAQAQSMLGLTLGDYDVNDVPKLLADAYGKFIPGSHGFAQVYVNISLVNDTTGAATPASGTVLMEGIAGGLDLAHLPLPLLDSLGNPFPPPPAGSHYQVSTVGTGHAFLNDIAHHAAPVLFDHDGNPATPKIQQIADLDIQDVNRDGKIDGIDIAANNHDVNRDGIVDARDLVADDGAANTYDNEMLDAHFLTGDGRGNENIGLTTVHTIFHSEHNRLVEANKDTIIASNDLATINDWLLTGAGNQITQGQLDALNLLPQADKAAAIDALNWDGERLFQAGRFVTEMQYQHLVFEEFARNIQPNVNPFVFTNSPDLDPSIVAEFAHVVYRFGHSMLSDTIDRLNINLDPVSADPQLGLIQAFLNPQAFTASGADASEAAGAIIRGMTRQVAGEIDEFVVQAVRDNLVGLPLDLPALNMARARDTGVPTFNHVREQFYTMTGDVGLKPYDSWLDFAQHIKNPISIINFIAAYGTHDSVTSATTADAKRAAATLLVMGDGNDADGIIINGVTYTDRQDFLNATGVYAGITGTAGRGGLDGVDLWIGGLAESKNEFGGKLGSTFNFVFETQMENLQNGDRMYYLSRTQGMNLLNQLEPNTFADLVMRNTDLGSLHSTHVNGTLFDTADAIIELDKLVAQDGDTFSGTTRIRNDVVWQDGLVHLTTKVERTNGTTDVNGDGEIDGNILKFHGGEHVVLGGTEGNDRLYGDRGIDTLWGDGGDDYLNGGTEADQVFGGDGDDIIEDPFGDGDFLRGNKGNDVISTSQGVGDVLFGDSGKDFIIAGVDIVEVFAGEGDDFVLGGTGGDGLMGNEGNDWIEGGEGFDGLSGENSDLFFNSPIIGHDVLNGQGNDTDYDGESGDDIMFGNAGITRANGMLGFDWVIQKGDTDTAGAVINLGISRFINQQALTLRDRADSVEGASGWKYNDTIIGTSAPTGAVGAVTGPVGGPTTDSMLLSQNVALITGLEALLKLTPGALRGQTVGLDLTPFSALPTDTVVFNPQTGADILLGGAGNDVIFGKAGNDIMDGDRWLNVRIEVHANRDGTGALVTNNAHVGADGSVDSLNEIKSDMLAGLINPGQLVIVRELLANSLTTNGLATANDYAQYAGAFNEYTITRNANGTVTVTDNVVAPILVIDPLTGLAIREALLDDEGTDTLSNFEFLRFTNRDANGVPTGTFTDISIAQANATGAAFLVDLNGGTPTEGQTLSVNTVSIADANGLGNFIYQWQFAPVGTAPNGVWTNIGTGGLDGSGQTTANYTPGQNQVGLILRVAVSFVDILGTTETIFSAPSFGVGEFFPGTAGNDNPTLTNFDDVATGLGGSDTFNGLAGADTLDGGAGDDTLTGGAGSDVVSGGDDNDSLIATVGDGSDSYDGGLGTDTYDMSGTTISATIIQVGSTVTATSGQTGLDTLTGVENFVGSSDDDTITLLAGNNGVEGRGGNDTISTGAGSDTVSGGLGNDTIDGGVGADILNGDAGDDTFNWLFGDGGDAINGGADVDLLRITGRAGVNDGLTVTVAGGVITTFRDGVTINTVTGVENVTADLLGNSDTLSYGTTAEAISVNLAAGTATGFTSIANIENATGGNGGDTLIGTVNANTLNGGVGADTITGGAGNDVIFGSIGNDTMVASIGDNNDSYNGGTEIDTYDLSATTAAATIVQVGSTVTSTSAQTGIDTLVAVENFVGGAGDDSIVLLAGANVVDGQGGNDTISTGASNDTIFGGAGNDILNGEAGLDIINGGSNDDTINGGTSADVLNGDAGNDTFTWLFGDGGDTINGGLDVDTINITGRAAINDTLTVNVTGGVITSFSDGATNNTVTGVENVNVNLLGLSDTLSYGTTAGAVSVNLATATASGFASIANIENATGGNGGDTLTGNLNANTLIGGAGGDTLSGGGGIDSLNGGIGADTLIGGAGADTINTGVVNDDVSDLVRFSAATEYGDTIASFDATGTAAQIDHVQLGGALNTLFDNLVNDDVFTFVSGDGINNNNVTVNVGTSAEGLYLSGVANEGMNNANLGNAALIAAEFNAEFNLIAANGEATLLVINDTNLNSASIWQWTQTAGGTAEIDASEMVRIATVNANATLTVSGVDLF